MIAADEEPEPSITTQRKPSASIDTAGKQHIPATLVWTNGDRLPGAISGLKESRVNWRSPYFVSPLTIDLAYLDSVQFAQAAGDPQSGEPMRFTLRNVDALDGRLIELTESHVVIQSRRHGRCKILRSSLQSFRRMQLPDSTPATLTRVSGWQQLHRERKLSDWNQNSEGEISTAVTGAELLSKTKLHPLSRIELSLRWKGKPGFLIGFADPALIGDSLAPVKLETWGDELVLQALRSYGDFKKLRTITEDTNSIELRMFWNQASGELSVYSEYGRLLGRLAAESKRNSGQLSLYIRNKGTDLTVANVRVSSWHGDAPKAVTAGLSRVLLTDGEAVYGQVREWEQSQAMLSVVEPTGTKRRIPIDQIAAVHFAEVIDNNPSKPQDRIAYFDGTLLSGTVESIDDGVLQLKTRYSDEPIEAGLEGARELRFHRRRNVPDPPDNTIEFEEGKLRGELTEVDATLGWRPVGSTNASALTPGGRARIVRESKDDGSGAETPADDDRIDVVYLKAGDKIPCQVERIDESHLHVSTPVSGETRIARGEVRAIEFNGHIHTSVTGFGEGWAVAKQGMAKVFPGLVKMKQQGGIEMTDEKIVVRGAAQLSHPDISYGDEVSFDVQWNTRAQAILGVRLYASSSNRAQAKRAQMRGFVAARGHQFQLYFLQKHMHVRAMQPRVRGAMQLVPLPDGRASLRFSLEDDLIHLFVNNIIIASQQVHAETAGQGIVLNIQQLNVNARKAKRNQNPEQIDLLTITNFKASRSKGSFQMLRINEEEKQRVLTVPRMRKKNPPQHVLLAQNGDLLRGRLIDVTADQARFESRLTRYEIPRDRLAGIIWLEGEHDEQIAPSERVDPSEAVEPKSGVDTVRAVLRNGVTVTLIPDRVESGKLIGDSPIFGLCRVPLNQVQELLMGDYPATVEQDPYADWVLRPAKEPQFAGTTGANSGDPSSSERHLGVDSPLVGTVAKKFWAQRLGSERLHLSEHAGKVVVLDFWATWCGPCVRAMPQLIETVDTFPSDRVVLLAVNQQEAETVVEEFMKTRGWDVDVALDRDGNIGELFQVDVLPQTVVIGPDGRIRRLYVGAHPDLQQEVKDALHQILDGQSERQPNPQDDPFGDAKESP